MVEDWNGNNEVRVLPSTAVAQSLRQDSHQASTSGPVMRRDGPTTHMPLLCFCLVPWLCFSLLPGGEAVRESLAESMQALLLKGAGRQDECSMPRNACLCTVNELQTEEVQKRQLLGRNEPPAFHQPQKSTNLMCFDQKFPFRPENPLIIKPSQSCCFLEQRVRQTSIFLIEQIKSLLALWYAIQQWNMFEQWRNRHFFKVNSRYCSEYVFTSALSAHWHNQAWADVFAMCSGTTSSLVCKTRSHISSPKPERVSPAQWVCIIKASTELCHGCYVAKTDGLLDCSKSK